MGLTSGARLGPYEILSPLGAGGMGEVFRARDTRLGREVALKTLPAEVANDPARQQRFEQEARAVAALNHPNIVAVFNVGEGHIVSELVEGEALSGLRPPLRRTLDIAGQIASGLSSAHAAGIIPAQGGSKYLLMQRWKRSAPALNGRAISRTGQLTNPANSRAIADFSALHAAPDHACPETLPSGSP